MRITNVSPLECKDEEIFLLVSICTTYAAIRSNTFQCQVRCYVGGCWPTPPLCPICPLCLVSWCDPSNFHFSPWSSQHNPQHLVDNISTHIFHSHCSSCRVPVASCWPLSLSEYFCLKDKTWLVPGRLYRNDAGEERRGEEETKKRASYQFVGMLMGWAGRSRTRIISQPDVTQPSPSLHSGLCCPTSSVGGTPAWATLTDWH